MVTLMQLQLAIEVVRIATLRFVDLGFFKSGVLTRLDQWIHNLPNTRQELARQIALKAAQTNTGTGADINGVALDERGNPSLESLVLHYEELEPGLFPYELVAVILRKLDAHGGPRFAGPWP